MKRFKNIYIFFFLNTFLKNFKNNYFFFKIFSLNLDYKIKNNFLKIANSALILGLKKFKNKNVLQFLEKNKNDLLFFYFNKKLYNNNNINFILNKNFFNIDINEKIKNFYFYFFFFLKKLYFIIKIKKL